MKKTYQYHLIAHPFTISLSICLAILFSIFSQSIYYLAACLFHILLVTYSHYYVRKCEIRWEITQKQDHLFTDETTDCSITFQNKSSLMIYEASFQFNSDEEIVWENKGFIPTTLIKNYYKLPFSLKKQEIKSFTFNTTVLKRGIFSWNNAHLVVNDPLRLITIHFLNIEGPYFHVYPNLRKVHLPESLEYQGIRKALVSPLYDETKLIGVKRYESEDFRSIHWGATAKNGDLMAKKYDFTQSDRYAVFVNLADQKGFSFHHKCEELIEIAIGTCKQLTSQNCSYEVWVNRETSNGLTHLPSGKNRKQLQSALQMFSLFKDSDTPISNDYFYRYGFRYKIQDAIPIVIGIPPRESSRKNQWVQITG
ncbi:DUF58 domain-containing protein [Bacillus sp. EAC]|uniref:DUF58 domain-containing protein n=1 Tax=Bacillus sp. EAC TaxID=1978338 RepID=UPI000B43A918|nr:DUF58 domain-containing protein [Bacillus sp. EAC]